MKVVKLKIVEVNPGFCQITYSCRNDQDQRIFYCLQDNGYGGKTQIRLLRATQEYEPDYEINKLKEGYYFEFEVPTGDSNIEAACREYIASNPFAPPGDAA
jgi:hypothetical protein